MRKLLFLAATVVPGLVGTAFSGGASGEQASILDLATADSLIVRVQMKDCGGYTRQCSSHLPNGAQYCVWVPNCKLHTYGSGPPKRTTNPRPLATGLKRLHPIPGGFRDKPRAITPVTPIGPKSVIPRRR